MKDGWIERVGDRLILHLEVKDVEEKGMARDLGLDRETAERWTQAEFERLERKAEEKIRAVVREELTKGLEDVKRSRIESAERPDADAHHHVSLSPRVFEGSRIQPGPVGERGNPLGSGGVHPGSCESEHRMLDGGAPRPEIRDESPRREGYWDLVEYPEHVPNKETPSHDVIFMIGGPFDAWAALVLEHEYEGFSISDRGRTACGLYDQIRRQLDTALPNWRDIWAPPRPKSSR